MKNIRSHIQTFYPERLLVCITSALILTLTACESSDDSSDAQELRAELTASNQLTTTGGIHLDLNDSIFDSIDSVSYSIKVTDAETNDVVYEIANKPANDIANLRINFSPLKKNIPHWQPYDLERLLAIDYTLHHEDGRSDSGRKYININERIAIGDVSVPATQPASRLVANGISDNLTTSKCPTVCFLSNQQLPTCRLSVSSDCYTVELGCLKDLANQTVMSTASDSATTCEPSVSGMADGPVTESTPAWFQAAGGYGGTQFIKGTSHRHRGHSGGSGGFALTVTTISDMNARLEEQGLTAGVIYYYAAHTGTHHAEHAPTGGPSTLVTTKAITGPIKDINNIILIAGGGGGASHEGEGGRGGTAIASAASGPKIFSSAMGDTGGKNQHGGNGGGSTTGDPTGGTSRSYGTTDAGNNPGSDGYGGNAGTPDGWVGWLNKDISAALDGQGTGGSRTNRYGGGGGGFGGGASGVRYNELDRGAGGGGSYAMASTITDEFAPTTFDFINERAGPMHLGSNGWVRVTFNILARVEEK